MITCDLWIYNLITNDIEIIHNFRLFSKESIGLTLYKYVSKQIPFQVEFVYR